MLIIYRSNRLEELLLRLTDILAAPLEQVMSPETIIVQSQGMARWLSLSLAEQQGISANLDCSFPAAFIWRLMRRTVGEIDLAAYEPEAMLWAIMELLGINRNAPGFAEVAGYLEGEDSDLRRYQLAVQLAGLFDKYMAYRPEWIRQWPERTAGHWQAHLWRALTARHDAARHRVALQDSFLAGLERSFLRQAKIPERLSIFGIPALPPSQFEVFARLAEFIDVHLFLLAPCREFWTDFVDARALVKTRLASGGLDPEADLHFEEGSPLLVSMGGLGREFQMVLQDKGDYPEDEFFIEPGDDSILAVLQGDILAGCGPRNSEPFSLSGSDQSIQIHVTHGPMREVEALHDQLLNLLCDPGLEPGDILVMTPDINLYAPLFDAVFSSSEGVGIPFSIADRPVSGTVIQSFVELLKVAASRAGAGEVMALLHQEPLRNSFAIAAEDLEILEAWVANCGIKWGLAGEAEKSGHGSWLAGMNRLLLGYALPGGERLFNDVLPCDLLEGGDGVLLGKLLNFVRALSELAAGCRKRRSLSEWQLFLRQGLDDFIIVNDDNLWQHQTIRENLAAMAEAATVAGTHEDMPFEVVFGRLKSRLTESGKGGNFLCGRTTFCQMAPMRSIPFKVICLLGMNDNAFPRHERPLGFDLSADERRIGDRSRRADDRYLFLETIISARRHLYISYVGLSDRDSRRIPPSVLVSELLDYLSDRLNMPEEEIWRRFMVQHPLQPFSRRCFQADLFSYSSRNREIAANLGLNREWRGLFAGPSVLGPEPGEVIELDEFIKFFAHPVQFLLRRRFGIYLADCYDELGDREPFSLDALEQYKITTQLLELSLAGHDVPEDACLARQQRGQLPSGVSGRYYFEQGLNTAAEVMINLAPVRDTAPLATQEINLDLGVFILEGHLNNLRPAGQYLYRPVKEMKFRDLIQAWINHLLISAIRPDLGLATFFVGRVGGKRYNTLPASEAVEALRGLARLFAAGQRGPLPLYPRTSYAYAVNRWGRREPMAHEQALERAMEVWLSGSYGQPPENSDPYLTAAYGVSGTLPGLAAEPLDDKSTLPNFVETAEIILAPALKSGENL